MTKQYSICFSSIYLYISHFCVLFMCTGMFIVILGAIWQVKFHLSAVSWLVNSIWHFSVCLSHGALYSSIFPYCHHLVIISPLLLSVWLSALTHSQFNSFTAKATADIFLKKIKNWLFCSTSRTNQKVIILSKQVFQMLLLSTSGISNGPLTQNAFFHSPMVFVRWTCLTAALSSLL